MAGDLLGRRPPLHDHRACWVLNHYEAAVAARLPTAQLHALRGPLPCAGENQAMDVISIGMAMGSDASGRLDGAIK